MHNLTLAVLMVALPPSGNQTRPVLAANPKINMQGYLQSVQAVASHRQQHRVTEEEFVRMSREPNTIILDARSKQKYDLLHVKGAVNLSFPDITVESLKRVIPDKKTRVLIYCNNNFVNAKAPFPTKRPIAALNISTYITLYNYGYRNIFELGSTKDPKESKLSFVSSP